MIDGQSRVSGAAALADVVRLVVAAGDDPGARRSAIEAGLLTLTADDLDAVIHSQFSGEGAVITSGLPASPGAAVGRVYFGADAALDASDRGEDVILVRQETTPADVHGMMASVGLLTTRGGLASLAALVARGWGTPAVVGADAIVIGDHRFSVGDIVVAEGDVISIDGATGDVILGALAKDSDGPSADFFTVLSWADEVRAGHLAVRANADTAVDAAKAVELGAEGIGLCRTEHMFLEAERLPIVRRMILALTPTEEAAALEELGSVQQADFEQILEAMAGRPVTVRLLDPPLHEFLPSVGELEMKQASEGLSDFEQRELDAARSWAEHNPMIGTRGVRLGVLKPGLYAMQVRALLGAVHSLHERGVSTAVEIMIPLTMSRAEMVMARSWVDDEIAAAHLEADEKSAISIGTMIETPRAALQAGPIAEVSDFFSFGTNDLTQLTFGFSRDDVGSRLIPAYIRRQLLDADPFETIDADAVAELVTIAVNRGRDRKPDLKLGVCGEHGGDPASIQIFHDAGLDYVSCSPYRVPIARLAAAQAVLRSRH